MIWLIVTPLALLVVLLFDWSNTVWGSWMNIADKLIDIIKD